MTTPSAPLPLRFPPGLSLAQLDERWPDVPMSTIRNWVYRQKILKPMPTSRGRRGRRGLLFSPKEVARFERTYDLTRGA